MTMPLDWRQIEADLVEWFRGRTVVYQSEGFWFAAEEPEINLTALAKHLADELGE